MPSEETEGRGDKPETPDEVVIRIVYDGPGSSGKTTTVRALAQEFGQTVHTPEERDGRTLFFDWTEVVGGRYADRRIRCQVVSVPGQPELAPRRRALLRDADAVVFVVDSTEPGLAHALPHLEDLQQFLAGRHGPPVGIVVQVNKRDLPDCIERSRLANLFERLVNAVPIETVATEGQGVRYGFVMAVRLAIDRLDALRRKGSLQEPERTEGTNPDALLEELVGAEAASGRPSTPAERPSRPEPPPPPVSLAAHRKTPPSLPESDLPSGRIWPPVEGRIVLHKAKLGGVAPQRRTDGVWSADVADRWIVRSPAEACFGSMPDGQQELVRWARSHSACRSLLSPGRCIVLAEAGDGTWRLWQVVQVEPSLRMRLRTALQDDAPAAAKELLVVGQALLEVSRRLTETVELLPVDLDTLGLVEDRPVFIGLFRSPGERQEGAWAKMSRGSALLADALEEELDRCFGEQPRLGLAVLEELKRRAKSSPANREIAEALLQVVSASIGRTAVSNGSAPFSAG